MGRLLASLRQARSARHRVPGLPARRSETWARSPLAIAVAGVVLLLGGIGAGVAAARWLERSNTPPPASLGASRLDLQALLPSVAAANAPIPALLEAAHGALDQGRLDEARVIYARVLDRDPRNVEAITHLGGVLYQEGRVEEALAKVEAALRIDPTYIHAHWDRTQYLFHGKRDFPAAIRAAEAFLQVAPTGPDAESVRALVAEARQKAATAPR